MHSPSFPEGDATCTDEIFVHVASPSGNEGECNRRDARGTEGERNTSPSGKKVLCLLTFGEPFGEAKYVRTEGVARTCTRRGNKSVVRVPFGELCTYVQHVPFGEEGAR